MEPSKENQDATSTTNTQSNSKQTNNSQTNNYKIKREQNDIESNSQSNNQSYKNNRYQNNGNQNNGNQNQNNNNNNNNQNPRYQNNNNNNQNPRYQNNNNQNPRYQNNNNQNPRYQNNGNQNPRYNKNNNQNPRYNKNNNDEYRNNNNKQTNYQNYTQDNEQSNENEINISTNKDNSQLNKEVYDDPNTLTPENILKREQAIIPIETFDDLTELIDMKIIRGVISYGFEEPSPIQKKAIKPLLGKFDIIAQAQSGTGKTATFCIGTLGRIDFEKNETQAIIIAHTLELAQQIEHVFTNIGKYTDLRIATAVKSNSVRENIETLLGRNNTEGLLPHVIIGTPGRILDMINKGAIDMETIRLLICDEADELLSDGFILQIRQIIGAINEKTQIGLFSATMDVNFFKITEKFLRNPINVLIKKENLTLEGIKQFYIDCEKNDWKFETLCDLYSLFSTCQTIIYCNYHQSVEMLTQKMQEKDFKVSYIHGGMTISDREEAMKKFRNLTTRVLISTDLLGRGIDVQQVSIVINYDIPFKSEAYIHRIGRSGRHGRKGTAINFVTNNDIKRMNDIEKYYDTHILPLPSNMDDVFQSNL